MEPGTVVSVLNCERLAGNSRQTLIQSPAGAGSVAAKRPGQATFVSNDGIVAW